MDIQKSRIVSVNGWSGTATELIKLKLRCSRCHSQKILSVGIFPINSGYHPTLEVCANCGYSKIEIIEPSHPDYGRLKQKNRHHPKYIELHINKSDVKAEIMDNWFYKID